MTASVYAAAYPAYRDRGWAPIKLEARTKYPPPAGFTGHDGADSSGADMYAWAEEEPDGNLALRLPATMIGVDVDAYDNKTGAAALAEAEKRWGRLPDSPRSTSRDDGISGIRLYKVPGVELVDRIAFPELGIGDIEIIQHHHRYAMCWPSTHPETERPYQWLGIDDGPLDAPPSLDDIPDLPAAWLHALRRPEHNGADLNDGARYQVRATLTDGEPTRRVAWKLGEAVIACRGASRHDHTRDHVLALLRYGKQGDTGVLPALKQLQEMFVTAVGPDRPGGRDQVVTEFRDFVNSDRVAQLLAQPDYERTADEPNNNSNRYYDGIPPMGGEPPEEDGADLDEPTTWEPLDLGPWLNGDIHPPQPSIGIDRSDGLRLIYPGREHAVLGETESGKTWFALGCVAAQLTEAHHVVYIHYEEGDPGSTIERLQLLGVDPTVIATRLHFVAPSRPAQTEWVTALLAPAPTLVVHDGVNEAMSLIGADIMAADGAANFRRRLISPFLRAGAASIACDHLPKHVDGRSREVYGSVHKGNALDGARIVLENIAPFGHNMRGVSHVFVTKDRPGYLRSHGRPTKLPGKTFAGTLVVDDMTCGPDFMMRLFAPRDDDGDDPAGKPTVTLAELGDIVHEVICALPGQTVGSLRKLFAEMRKAGQAFNEHAIRNAVDDLIVAGRLAETPGKRGATTYRAISTAAQESDS